MTSKPILTIDLVSDHRTLVNGRPGFTWPEALKGIYPKNESQSFSIPIEKNKGEGHRFYNYTEDCQEFLFSGYSNIYGCAAIAISAVLVQDGRYEVDAKNIRKASENLIFGDLESFDGVGVLQQILNCTRASCQNPSLEDRFGPCGRGVEELPASFNRTDDIKNLLNPMQFLCSGIKNKEPEPAVPEPDIAGPGVTMAYIMQIFLGSWFIWFSILIPRDPKSSFAAKAARTLRRLRRRYLKQSHLREEGRTEYWLAILRNCRFSEVLFSTLVEFQEAQVFFTLAVQLASISMLVLNESISAKRIDWVAAKLFQAGNTFVVLLVQAEQQRQRMHWWYTYLLTLIVCVFFVAIQRIGLESEFIGSEELPECSFKLPSILKTCDYGVGVYIPTFQEAAMEDSSDFSLSIVLISLSFITLDQVAQTPRLRNWGVDVWQSTSKAVKWMTKFGSVVWSLLWLVMNCSLASLLLSTTDTILREVGGSLSEKDNWTFGQIVAVLLWAPVVFKYIYLNIFGVKRGFDSRLDSHYEVVLSSERPQLPPRPSQQSTDGIPLTSTGYKNVPNNEDGREYVGLEDPRTPKWGRQYSASSRDGASSVGITEPQSFPWSNSR